MNRTVTQFFIAVVVIMITGSTASAQWTSLTPANLIKRARATTFTIGDTAYIGNGNPTYGVYTKRFSGYTSPDNSFNETRLFPGNGGDQGFSFVINGDAYIGDGANPAYQNGFWKYNPVTGWTSLGNAAGGPRAFCAGFAIGDKGYFGTGLQTSNVYKDFYEYDPATGVNGTWTKKADMPGTEGRYGAVGFSANGKGYIGLGYNTTTYAAASLKDMYEYDPATDSWRAMASLPSADGQAEGAYFVLCNKLILTSGQKKHGTEFATAETWVFDPAAGADGTWYRLPDFPGTLSYAPNSFALRDTGYVHGGTTNVTSNYVLQLWRYVPSIDYTSVTPDASVCPGGATVLKVDGSSVYKWSPAAGLSDTLTASSLTPGAVTQVTAAPAVTTTYTITELVCGAQTTIRVTVKDSLPPLHLTNDTSFCDSFALVLDAGTTGLSYRWSTGDTLPAISVSSFGTYSLTVTDGCSVLQDSVTVTGGSTRAGVVSALRDTICSGTPGNLTVTGSSGAIQWQSALSTTGFSNVPSAQDVSLLIIPDKTSYYRVYTTDGYCSDTSLAFKLVVVPSPAAAYDYTFSGSNSLTVSFNSDSSKDATIYNWDFGDGTTESNASNPVHTFPRADTFHVCLTVFNGSNCSFTVCKDIPVGLNDVETIAGKKNLFIIPNPFSNLILVRLTNPAGYIKSVELIDVLGRIVQTEKPAVTAASSVQFNTATTAKGMYYLKVITEAGIYVQKVVKQ